MSILDKIIEAGENAYRRAKEAVEEAKEVYRRAKEAVEEAAEEAEEWLKEKGEKILDWFAGEAGHKDSYSGTSVSETIDYAKLLSDYLEKLEPEATKMEEKKIPVVLSAFDIFSKEIQTDYPDLVGRLSQRKEKVEKSTRGTFVNYVRKKASLDNPEYKEMLEMPAGDEKTKEAKRLNKKILDEADKAFNKLLQEEMMDLYNELKSRFESEVQKREADLKKEEKTLKDLSSDEDSQQSKLDALKKEQQFYNEWDEQLRKALKDEVAS